MLEEVFAESARSLPPSPKPPFLLLQLVLPCLLFCHHSGPAIYKRTPLRLGGNGMEGGESLESFFGFSADQFSATKGPLLLLLDPLLSPLRIGLGGGSAFDGLGSAWRKRD